MQIGRVLGTALLGLVCAASYVSLSSAGSPPLSETVSPADIKEGSVRLSFSSLSFDGTGPAAMVTISAEGSAMLHLDKLSTAALVRCSVGTDDDARIRIEEYLESGADYGPTGQSIQLVPGPTEVEFIAEPNPVGDYMYEMKADEGSWTLTQCTVEGLS